MAQPHKNSSNPAPLPRQSSCNSSSRTRNPLATLNLNNHNRSSSEGDPRQHRTRNTLRLHLSRDLDKENTACPDNNPSKHDVQPENPAKVPANPGVSTFDKVALKPTSLQLCMLSTEPDSTFGADPIDHSGAANVWDHSDSEAAPASSWSNLPNRTLLSRPLPVDVGRCTCVILKEKLAPGGSVYSLYTNEGKGRQDRKLAIACHKRKNGRSVFIVAQNVKGILSSSDDNFLGTVTSNLVGSKYHIWDQGVRSNSLPNKSNQLQGVVAVAPTISTWAGSYRSMKTWITKHQSIHQKSLTQAQAQHSTGLLKEWDTEADKVQQLFSRPPHYNNITKQYELDFRDRGRPGLRIQKSVKNFQLASETTGRQTSLQLGRVGKSKYVMDYR
uniref:Tubby C-terminal domain-containing protein n=1 Tax=Kalanchoe fedtschenkoi TaxID=63787 RepID=A0A7N0TFL7_KALFE